MTGLPFPLLIAVSFLAAISFQPLAHALGSGSTLAVAYGTATVCAIVAAESTQRIICYRAGDNSSTFVEPVSISPSVSYSIVAGGKTDVCAIRSGGSILLCWKTDNLAFPVKRLYNNSTNTLQSLAIGGERICATTNDTSSSVACWRPVGNNSNSSEELPHGNFSMGKITSGSGFSCGIVVSENNTVKCWGNNPMGRNIAEQFGNMSMLNMEAGFSHVCGVNFTGDIVCRGNKSTAQLKVPSNKDLKYPSGLALGEDFSCAIRRSNGTVVCWGSMNETAVRDINFKSIVSGLNFACGITTRNLSVVCWGPGWPNSNTSASELRLGAKILPGPCVQSSCECGVVGDSSSLCSAFGGNICNPSPCSPTPSPPLSPSFPEAPPPATSTPSSPSKELKRGLLAFAIVGSVGSFMGICTVFYCLWTGVCFGKKKVHNSVQPTITRAGSNGGPGSNSSPPSRSLTIRRQSSRAMKRQRSGTSSTKHADRAEEFSLAELAAATNDFSLENKIGAGSFGVVYRGKLMDGREVAIKRGETDQKTKKFQEKESAFESELAFLSRLHHKHLVRLVGYCEERDERLLVYEFMKNGALYDHLHDKNNVEKSSSVLNSWKMRIKIALDAARGIEYLHNYAVPPIIHRDIKSSNILLDANWTARVSDFGLSLMGPESDRDYRPMKAAGTVGYIDPEYYGLNVLTAKSDVYGLGIVMLELLTGKRAIFKSDESGGTPVSLVDYAVPAIMAGELVKVLDPKVGLPELNETEAVELMAYTAMHCVNLEGKERPTIGDIVSNLERAVTVCDGSHGSISSSAFSIVSE